MKTQSLPLDLELVANVFNRLAELESQGYHDDQTFFKEETVWALLAAMGQTVDMSQVETLCFHYGQLLEDVFSAMTAGDLEAMLKPLAGVSLQTNNPGSPFAQWAKGQGAQLNESDFDPLCPKCKRLIDGCYGGCLACDLEDDDD